MGIKPFSLFLLLNFISYAQSSNSVVNYSYKTNVVELSLQYPDTFNTFDIYEDEFIRPDNCFTTLTWENNEPDNIDSQSYDTEKLIYINIFASPENLKETALNNSFILSGTKWYDKDFFHGKTAEYIYSEDIDFNGWKGFKTYTEWNGAQDGKEDSIHYIGFRYLLFKIFGETNLYVEAEVHNAADILVTLRMICNSVKFKEMPFDYKPNETYKNIRDVDFLNFSYKNTLVKDGEFYLEVEDIPESYTYLFEVSKPVYGDLTGDGEEEAVIHSYDHTLGTTGHFTGGFVYALKSGKPIILYELDGGDRADNEVEDVEIKNGLLVVINNFGIGGLCCPEYHRINYFRWIDTAFVKIKCEMKSINEVSKCDTLLLNHENDEISISDSMEFDKFFILKLEKGKHINIQCVNSDTKWPFYVVLSDKSGNVVTGCDLPLNNLEIEIPETDFYYIRLVTNYWIKDFYTLKIKQW